MSLAHLETARLRLRPLTRADADALHRLWTTPKVRRYLWDDTVIPKAETAEILEKNERLFRDQGYGLWSLRRKRASTLLGFCGYWFFFDPPERQLVYGLAPKYWGEGLATEATRSVIRYGFETLGFARIIGCTDVPNTASMRVMERAGMIRDRAVTIHGQPMVYYAITRDAFAPDDDAYPLKHPSLD
jgi:ribosomal-protein-alanine N-acetyltransferase